MRLLWERGENSVRDMLNALDGDLAYTTVMTTLDRLFRKGLVTRRLESRAFYYSACIARSEFIYRRVRDAIEEMIPSQEGGTELLISFLMDAVKDCDPSLLDELEKKIRRRRHELSEPSAPGK